MFAVIQTGGKQYKVAEHDVIHVEKLPGEAGETVELDEVLMLGKGADAEIGAPLVEGARVVATILEQARAPKILVFKKKRRKNYRRTRGHRQDLTVLRVTDILSAGEKPKKPAKKAAPAPVAAQPATPAPKAEAAPKKDETAPAKAALKKAEPKKAEPKKAEPKKAEPKKAEAKKAAPKKAAPKKAAPEKTEDVPAKAKAAPKKATPKKDETALAKAKSAAKKSAPKKSAATKAPAETKSAAKPKAKTGKGSGKEKA